MSQLTIILFIAISCLIALFIWNSINFRTLKKLSTKDNIQLNDAKYWELKYKYEFLIAIVAIISSAAGFLGYNSIKSIEASVTEEFTKKVDSVKNEIEKAYTNVKILDSNATLTEETLRKNASTLNILKKDQLLIKLNGFQSKKSLIDLTSQIDSINVKNKIKREFYLVPNVEFKGEISINNILAKIKFSDLRTRG